MVVCGCIDSCWSSGQCRAVKWLECLEMAAAGKVKVRSEKLLVYVQPAHFGT